VGEHTEEVLSEVLDPERVAAAVNGGVRA
jgi:hypothetical protein